VREQLKLKQVQNKSFELNDQADAVLFVKVVCLVSCHHFVSSFQLDDRVCRSWWIVINVHVNIHIIDTRYTLTRLGISQLTMVFHFQMCAGGQIFI
jgi:hypothetical protein